MPNPNNDTRETTNREIRTNEATLSKEEQEKGEYTIPLMNN